MQTTIQIKSIESCIHAIQYMPLSQWYQLIHNNIGPSSVIYVINFVHMAEKGR
jgi:hypothetical protein